MLPPAPVAPPQSAPAPVNDDLDVILHQVTGALIAILGVCVTVLGLHGMTIHGKTGSFRKCTMSARWCGYLGLWAAGQILQLLAVKLAEEAVVAAVSNFAIIANAILAYRMLGERISMVDMAAIIAMVVGACLVVYFVPAQTMQLTIDRLVDLFTQSAAPAAGLVATAAVPVLVGTPLALHSCQHSRHEAAGELPGDAVQPLAGQCGRGLLAWGGLA